MRVEVEPRIHGTSLVLGSNVIRSGRHRDTGSHRLAANVFHHTTSVVLVSWKQSPGSQLQRFAMASDLSQYCWIGGGYGGHRRQRGVSESGFEGRTRALIDRRTASATESHEDSRRRTSVPTPHHAPIHSSDNEGTGKCREDGASD